MRERTWTVMAVVLGAVALMMGCSGEMERGEYRDLIAQEVCDEAERCNNLGPNGLHDTYDDCIVEERARFNDMWPTSQCGETRINEDAFDRCLSRALDVACDGTLADWFSAGQRCHRDEVCID